MISGHLIAVMAVVFAALLFDFILVSPLTGYLAAAILMAPGDE